MTDDVAETSGAGTAVAAAATRPGTRPRVLVITGMSGAGKTTALKTLEDLGFECIDHLPLRLLPRLLLASASEVGQSDQPLAIGVDVRTRDFGIDSCMATVERLRREDGISINLVFLYCDDEELRRRYTATRHRHPLASHLPLIDGIARERQILSPLRNMADLTIDTTGLNPGDLKRMLQGHFGLSEQTALAIQVISFSFRSGLPRDADLVFDVRFFGNPFYQPDLKPLTGRDAPVAEFIRGDPRLRSVLRFANALASTPAAALRRRGEELPDHRRRLHRRPASIGVRRGRAGDMAAGARDNECRCSTGIWIDRASVRRDPETRAP